MEFTHGQKAHHEREAMRAQKAEFSAAHAEGLHDDLPRDGCPECGVLAPTLWHWAEDGNPTTRPIACEPCAGTRGGKVKTGVLEFVGIESEGGDADPIEVGG